VLQAFAPVLFFLYRWQVLAEDIMGKEREHHDDGSDTDRYDDYHKTSVTYNQDGSTRESSRDESSMPFGNTLMLDNDVRVTKEELPRRLLKVSGGSVDDYATFSASTFTIPSC
jgi:hypothetical protein